MLPLLLLLRRPAKGAAEVPSDTTMIVANVQQMRPGGEKKRHIFIIMS